MKIVGPQNEVAELPALRTLDWFDPLVGGGLRPGAVYVLAGVPGGSKSTLAMQLTTACALRGTRVLLVLTEQTPSEVRSIFERVTPGADHTVCQALSERVDAEVLSSVDELPAFFRRRVPVVYPGTQLLIVDSLQGPGLPSTATRTYRRVFEYLDEAKARGIVSLLVSHVTKRGTISGPRSLEHKADVVLQLRKAARLRHLFVSKNRFGTELTEPFVLDATDGRLAPSPHAHEVVSAALGYAGEGDELIQVQTSVSLPRLGRRGELVCPYLPAKRVAQVLGTLSKLRGIELGDLTYSINAYVPTTSRYLPVAELPLAVAMLAAYLQLPLPEGTLYVGEIDLRRVVGAPRPAYLQALATLISEGVAPNVERVVLSAGAVGMLADSFPHDRPRPQVRIMGVRTVDELLAALWPEVLDAHPSGNVPLTGDPRNTAGANSAP